MMVQELPKEIVVQELPKELVMQKMPNDMMTPEQQKEMPAYAMDITEKFDFSMIQG